MAETKKTPIEAAKEKYEIAMKAANDALGKSPVDVLAYGEAIESLKKAEEEYKSVAENDLYVKMAGVSSPILAIVKEYAYIALSHKEITSKETGRVTSVEPKEKEYQIDLLKFCNRAKLNTDWEFLASKFNQLMCLRAAKALGCDVKEIAKTYFLKEKAREIDMGGTPTSNTQVVKLLQRVVDGILPNVDEEGNKIYKVNNYDVAYLDDLYGKKGKERLSIKVSNDKFFLRILVDICYRLATRSSYSVNGFKGAKSDKKA